MLSANCRNWGPHIYPFKILCFRTRISRIVSVDFVGCWRGELDQISGWFRCEWYEDGGRLRRNHFITSAPSSSHPFNDQPHFFFGGPKWTIASTTKFQWWLWDDYCWMVLDRSWQKDSRPEIVLEWTQTCSLTQPFWRGSIFGTDHQLGARKRGTCRTNFGCFLVSDLKAPYEQNSPCECPDLGDFWGAHHRGILRRFPDSQEKRNKAQKVL